MFHFETPISLRMKQLKKSTRLKSLAVVALLYLPLHSYGYEIWMGTLGWEKEMVTSPEAWAGTAAAVDGLNVNWAPGKNNPNRLSLADRKAVIERFTRAKNHAYQVVPHGDTRKTDESEWERTFSRAKEFGYKLDYLYTYSSGPQKNWKPEEHDILRKWLDNNGHAEVKIAFNGRSGRGVLERPTVQGNGIECDLTSWKENKGERHELLQWMADPQNAATKGEKIVIHCHLNFGKSSTQADLVDAWAGARLMIRDISRDIFNTKALQEVFRSDRLVFAFFGENWRTPEITLLPETKDTITYAESYTGLLLSLVEQRALFEGRTGTFPTDEQCKSFTRVPPPKHPALDSDPER